MHGGDDGGWVLLKQLMLNEFSIAVSVSYLLASRRESSDQGGWVSEESQWRSEKAAVSNNKTDKLN